MVIVKLQHGQGNQMFQYACGRALALRQGSELKLDLHYLFDRRPAMKFVLRKYELAEYQIEQSFASRKDVIAVGYGLAERIRCRLLRRTARWHNRFYEWTFEPVNDAVLQARGHVYLDGYFQSPAYFKDYASTIRDDFQLWRKPEGRASDVQNRIASCESVCVHVRRADYLSNEILEACSIDYYRDAMSLIGSRLPAPEWFVFSDDIPWCRANFPESGRTRYVDLTDAEGSMHWYHELMRSCRHFVIPNSTFGWWAAYLSESPEKIVIAPQQWFRDPERNKLTRDLIPNEWERL